MGIIISLMFVNDASASDYTYEHRKIKNHVIHIVTLNINDYDVQLIKAHNQAFGRETVESIAVRSNADIAINGGFFEIGGDRDGMPSGTLVIDGNIIGLKSQKQACLIKKLGQLSIAALKNNIKIKIGNEAVPINKVNQFFDSNSIILYTPLWGTSTLTSFKGRKEVALGPDYKILHVYEHGNVDIPRNGFVISFPTSHAFGKKALKTEAKIDFSQSLLASDKKVSAVMGIPQILEENKIRPEILQNQSSFYADPHARTAVGLKPNGDVVIIVAEHVYKKPLTEITLGEVRSILQNNKVELTKKYQKMPHNLTLNELKEIIKDEFTAKNEAVGLTMHDLANVMLEEGCHSAINLDGGGSSTLWVDGKVINKTTGDKDESMGQSVLRPVSDAILFKKKT